MPSLRQKFASLALCAFALAASLTVTGCGSKSGGVSGPTGGTATINGFISLAGTGDIPVAGATVTSTSGASTTTNAGGQFTLTVPAGQDVRLDVTKANHTLNQLHVTLASGERRAVAVGLLAAGNIAPVVVASGGSLTDLSSNAKITFPPGFVNATGPVSVTITGLDPTTDQIQALPGGLRGAERHQVSQAVSFAIFGEGRPLGMLPTTLRPARAPTSNYPFPPRCAASRATPTATRSSATCTTPRTASGRRPFPA
jgi:hypothetical protein